MCGAKAVCRRIIIADGRFTAQDSYRGDNTDEGTWNLYAYCTNNPIINIDPSGHNKILSIYYNGTKKGSLKKFSKKPWYYKKSQSDYEKANTYEQLKNVWNKKLKKKYKKVFVYIHGGKGCLYFHEKPQKVSANKLSEALKKKKSVKKLYLLICKGAKGGEKSVAYAFHKKAPNASVYASKVGVSFVLLYRQNSDRSYRAAYKPVYAKREYFWNRKKFPS